MSEFEAVVARVTEVEDWGKQSEGREGMLRVELEGKEKERDQARAEADEAKMR